MRLTRRRRWLCAALLAPLVMLAVSASSFSALRCTMSGLLLPETCCPTAEGAAPAEQTPASPALQEAGCCERIVITNAKAPAVATDRADAPPGPVVFLVASAVAVAARGARPTGGGCHGPTAGALCACLPADARLPDLIAPLTSRAGARRRRPVIGATDRA